MTTTLPTAAPSLEQIREWLEQKIDEAKFRSDETSLMLHSIRDHLNRPDTVTTPIRSAASWADHILRHWSYYKTEKRDYFVALVSEIQKDAQSPDAVRNAALEEAAEICDNRQETGDVYAAQIRALKSPAQEPSNRD